MTLRQLTLAWGLALAIVIIVTLGLIVRAERSGQPGFDPAAIAVIGSSPTMFAIPGESAGGDSLLGNGVGHRRLAKILLTEAETLTLLDRAIEARASTILVEANPLLIDFAFAAHQRPCDGWKMALRGFASEQRDRVRSAFRGFRTPEALATEPDPALMRASKAIDMAVVDHNYPLVLRPPCAGQRLKLLAERARARKIRLVLFLTPRSPFAAARIGPATLNAIDSAARTLGAQLGAELFVPDGQWADAEFVDFAHVNTVGRRHFGRALRRWWAAR